MSLLIRRLAAPELAWANERYDEVGFVRSQHHDLIAIAEVSGVPAGLGRLTAIEGPVGELGGIYVLAAYRGRDIAREIVTYLLRHSGYATLFCIPFARLEGFYGAFGFMRVPAEMHIPRAVTDKVTWCENTYADAVTLLVRRAT